MAFTGLGIRPRRPMPTFGGGWATGQSSERPDLWRGLTAAFAPFLGSAVDPLTVLFGSKIIKANVISTFDLGSDRQGSWSGGRARRFKASSNENLTLGKTDDLISPTECTIAIGFRRIGTTGTPVVDGFVGTSLYTFDRSAIISAPNTSDALDWMFSNVSINFSNYTGAAGGTQLNTHVIVVTAGPLGMQIWFDGRRVANTPSVPVARVLDSTNEFNIGKPGGTAGTMGMDVGFCYVWNHQLPEAAISDITNDPGVLFRPLTRTVGVARNNITLPSVGDGQASLALGLVTGYPLNITLPAEGAGTTQATMVVIDLFDIILPAEGAGTAQSSMELIDFFTSIATGSTNASRGTVASEGNSYAGVRYATAMLGSGYVGIFGGKTVDGAGVEIAVALPTVFRFVATGSTFASDQSMHFLYEWRRPSSPLIIQHAEDAQAVSLIDPFHDGQVLLTGGHFQTSTVSSAATIVTHRPASPGPEIFTAVPTAPMGAARGMHRASVLTDGKVLVTGGFTVWPTPLATAERWNPALETWSAATSMNQARMDHAQIVLTDGRVMVAGGLVNTTTQTNRVEIYSPISNTWTSTGNMGFARAGHALTMLPSGQVLVTGGTGRNASLPGAAVPLAVAELWDPGTGTWRPAGTAPAARARPAATYVASLGGVLVAGGDSTEVDLWSVANGAWRRSLAVLPRVRRDTQAVMLPDGLVLLPGGTEFNGSFWTTTEHSSIITPGSELVANGRIDGEWDITDVPIPTMLRYESHIPGMLSGGIGGTVTPLAAPEVNFAGAHIVDIAGVAITATQATVGVALQGGASHTVLTLASSFADPDPALRFPNKEGFLVLRYGREGQAGPIKYLGRLSTVDLRLDASFVFPGTAEVGDDVTLLNGRDAFLGGEPADGYLYATASPAGRAAASATLDRVVAAGVEVAREIIYPGDVGLGAAGAPTSGTDRLSSIVTAFAGNDLDSEIIAAREG